uniref:Ion transport domain-containing protein n=1 Tax=Pyramimonas obovata TaxID=1411642 RepID=A0A7S0QZZ5_9CHLO|mmetsp:Transcript_20510/g.44854  ORF Transcript_20510/g.44854 Transcript_20510/m.44854 type:complete len:930 (+) Transcript_20510:596-3385(+)
MRNFQANDLSSKGVSKADQELKKRLPDWVKSADAKANWQSIRTESELTRSTKSSGDSQGPSSLQLARKGSLPLTPIDKGTGGEIQDEESEQEAVLFEAEMGKEIEAKLELLKSNSNRLLRGSFGGEAGRSCSASTQHLLRAQTLSHRDRNIVSKYIAEKSVIHVHKHPLRRILEQFETKATEEVKNIVKMDLLYQAAAAAIKDQDEEGKIQGSFSNGEYKVRKPSVKKQFQSSLRWNWRVAPECETPKEQLAWKKKANLSISELGDCLLLEALKERNRQDTPVSAREVVQIVRLRVWLVLSDTQSSLSARIVSLTILLLIVVTSITFCMETMPQFEDDKSQGVFDVVEITAVSAFTLEYTAKLLCAPQWREFVCSPLNVVDLVAILPFFIELAMNALGGGGGAGMAGTRIVRMVRLVRVFRVLKLGTHYGKIQVMWKTMVESVDVLGMMGFLMCLSVIIFSATMYNVEQAHDPVGPPVLPDGHPSIPEDPTYTFDSIPGSFWWCIVTLMTVGYGDFVPHTVLGKMTAAGAMLVSVFILALPITVIGTNFNQQWAEFRKESKYTNARPTAVMVKNLSKKVSEHCSLLEDMLRRCMQLEVEVQDQLVKLKEVLGQLQGVLAPGLKRKHALISGVIKRLSAGVFSKTCPANPPGDEGDNTSFIKNDLLSKYKNELKLRGTNGTVAAITHMLNMSDERPEVEQADEPGQSPMEMIFAEMQHGEEDPVESLLSILELEKTLRGTLSDLRHAIARTSLLVGEDLPDLVVRSRQQYRHMTQLVGQSTVLYSELSDLNLQYEVLHNRGPPNPEKPSKSASTTEPRSPALGIPKGMRNVLTRPASASSLLRSSSAKMRQEPKEVLTERLKKLCELLSERENRKDQEALHKLREARREGLQKAKEAAGQAAMRSPFGGGAFPSPSPFSVSPPERGAENA